MSFVFRPAKRENVPLLLGVAGGTGSGKTYSALLLARGIANGGPVYGIDTENRRMLHYADEFDFIHGELKAPFRPSRYAEAIEAADKAGAAVIVVDSMSHEWTGDGGVLDWQEEEMRGQESRKMLAWQAPKKDHRRMLTRLLQVNAHVILCFRASERVEMIDDPEKPGKKKVVPKKSLTGLDGWIPEAEPRLPYELTASFLVTADRPGFPKPIKLQEQHRSLVPLDAPLSEDVGRALAAWARGSGASSADVDAVLKIAAQLGEDERSTAAKAIEQHREKYGLVSVEWLGKLRKALEKKLPADTQFKAPAGVSG